MSSPAQPQRLSVLDDASTFAGGKSALPASTTGASAALTSTRAPDTAFSLACAPTWSKCACVVRMMRTSRSLKPSAAMLPRRRRRSRDPGVDQDVSLRGRDEIGREVDRADPVDVVDNPHRRRARGPVGVHLVHGLSR